MAKQIHSTSLLEIVRKAITHFPKDKYTASEIHDAIGAETQVSVKQVRQMISAIRASRSFRHLAKETGERSGSGFGREHVWDKSPRHKKDSGVKVKIPVTKEEKPAEATAPQPEKLSPYEIGESIISYVEDLRGKVRALSKENANLQEILSERDEKIQRLILMSTNPPRTKGESVVKHHHEISKLI